MPVDPPVITATLPSSFPTITPLNSRVFETAIHNRLGT
jgi:hypothetical protein